MPLNFETVAIPVVKGIDVNTSARLVQPPALLEALNSRFPRGSGATKRRGHLSSRVRASMVIPPGITAPSLTPPSYREPYSVEDTGLPEAWLWGWGVMAGEGLNTADALPVSPHPTAGLLFGVTKRDDEALLWDGFRLYSHLPGQDAGANLPSHNAVMPHLRAAPVAKTGGSQTEPDAGDNGHIRVVAWLDNGTATYTVLDSTSGAIILPAAALPGDNVTSLRVIPAGNWVHIITAPDDGTIKRFTIHAETPRDYEMVSIGTCNGHFDLWKVDEASWVVARNNGNDDATAITVTYHRANGTVTTTLTPDLGDDLEDVGALGLAVHPTTGRFALAFRGQVASGLYLHTRLFTAAGIAVSARVQVDSVVGIDLPVTMAPLYMQSDSGEVFNIYWENVLSLADEGLKMARVDMLAGTTPYTVTREYVVLASAAFRVGNRTFVWAGRPSTYQSTWVLLDEELLPVGRMDFITANIPSPGAMRGLASVNWRGAATLPAKDRVVFHGGLGFRVRVATEAPSDTSNVPVVYAEPSVRFYELDFLPPLRAAQAGRTTYFAGAQVWAYDGYTLTEGAFPFAPEGVEGVPSGSGSGLGAGDYRYRVDLCHRNAQGEEVRSASFYTDAITTTAGQDIDLTIPGVLTRRDAYLLIFRNEVDGSQWYLVNSRDPASPDFLVNDPNAEATWKDEGAITDANLGSREFHPGNGGFGYLDAFPAPACELIVAGHDRLWVAGGEIPAGQVHPSRLYIPGETPTFNASLAIQVDRAAEPITAIGFVGDLRVYFRKTQTYVHNADGPDNSSNGSWETVRLAYADVGAISPDGLGLITAGLVFQSPAGIRLLGPGGGINTIGLPVDALAKSLRISSTLVCGEDQEVRFYSTSGDTLVWNYQYDAWSTWTVRATGAVRNPDTGLAVIATPDGNLWTETEGVWLDNGAPYKHRVRFGWLRHGNLGDFQRIRRVMGIGEAVDEHNIHMDLYYDERDFAEEWFDWAYPDPNTQNTDTLGEPSTSLGDGFFGDSLSTWFRDSVWRWRRRPSRQKCSVISVAIDDAYSPGPGFVLTALGLEIGRKPGLDRVPWRNGTSTTPSGSGSNSDGH